MFEHFLTRLKYFQVEKILPTKLDSMLNSQRIWIIYHGNWCKEYQQLIFELAFEHKF